MADKNQGRVRRSLKYYGAETRPALTLPENGLEWGEADLIVDIGGRTTYVEVKRGIDGYSLNPDPKLRKWHEGQRKWAQYIRSRGREYWIWLELGPDKPHLSAPKYKPQKAWLIPYIRMMKIVELITPFQLTLPYQATRGTIKLLGLDACTLLADLELKYVRGKQRWEIPTTHPFYKFYIEPPAINLLYEEEPDDAPTQKASLAVLAYHKSPTAYKKTHSTGTPQRPKRARNLELWAG